MKLFYIGLVAINLLFSQTLFAADVKIGYVQVDKILQEAPQTTETGKKLEKEFLPRSQELDRMQKQMRDLQTTLDKETPSTSESDRRSKERELSNLNVEFQRKQRELREDVNIRKNEELSVLQDKINKAVTTVAQAEGFDLVVYSGVAYASNRIDITDKVLRALGKK